MVSSFFCVYVKIYLKVDGNMTRNDKKNIYNDLKTNFSKSLYKCRKNILKVFDGDYWNNRILLKNVDEFLKNEEAKKTFLETYAKYPVLAQELLYMEFNFDNSTLTKIFEIYGEKLLTDNTYIILSLEKSTDYNGIDKGFIPFAKDYPKQFEKLINQYGHFRFIISELKEKNIELETILKNLDKIEILKNTINFRELNKNQCETLLKLDYEHIKLLISVYDRISNSNLANKNDRITCTDLLKYLFINPTKENIQFFENLFTQKITGATFDDYFKKETDIKHLTHLAKFYLNSDASFYSIKAILKVLFFKLYGVSNIESQIKDLLQNPLHGEYPDYINDYLTLYNQLENCQNKEDLQKFLNAAHNFKILSYDEIKEFLIVNYNRNLNKILLNPDKLYECENIQIRYEPFEYEENGVKITKNIKIITIKNISFTSLTTSIDYKVKDACLSDEQYYFNSKLVDNPYLWVSKPKHGTNYISLSANTNKYFKTFGSTTQLVAGFSNMKDRQVKAAFASDAGTNMQAGTTIDPIVTELNSIDDLTKRTTMPYFGVEKSFAIEHHYNEVISDRDGVIPDYFLSATEENNARVPLTTDERTLKWAAFFDKPVIEIDCSSYYNSAIKNFYKEFTAICHNPCVPSMQDLKRLEILKAEAETFYKGHIIDYYDLVYQAISMQNREWNMENINRLNDIIKNTFDSERSNEMYESQESSLLLEQRKLKEQERKETIARFKNIIKAKSQEILNNFAMDNSNLNENNPNFKH